MYKLYYKNIELYRSKNIFGLTIDRIFIEIRKDCVFPSDEVVPLTEISVSKEHVPKKYFENPYIEDYGIRIIDEEKCEVYLLFNDSKNALYYKLKNT